MCGIYLVPKFAQLKTTPYISQCSLTPPCSPRPAARKESPGKGCPQTELCPRRPSGAHSAGSGSGGERGSHSPELPVSLSTSHPAFTRGGGTLSQLRTQTCCLLEQNYNILINIKVKWNMRRGSGAVDYHEEVCHVCSRQSWHCN